MNATNLYAALLRCTCDDGRPLTAAPFPAVVDGRPVRIATTGKVLLMVDDPAGDAGATCEHTSVLDVVQRCADQPKHRASRAALIAWAGQDYRQKCAECEGGLVGSQKCRECRGEGVVYCDLDHEHDCPACDGEGWTGAPCAACEKTGLLFHARAPISIPALSCVLDAHLIGGLIDLLPGDEIGILSIRDFSVTFRGPGWMLIVMGLNMPADRAIRALDVSPMSMPENLEARP